MGIGILFCFWVNSCFFVVMVVMCWWSCKVVLYLVFFCGFRVVICFLGSGLNGGGVWILVWVLGFGVGCWVVLFVWVVFLELFGFCLRLCLGVGMGEGFGLCCFGCCCDCGVGCDCCWGCGCWGILGVCLVGVDVGGVIGVFEGFGGMFGWVIGGVFGCVVGVGGIICDGVFWLLVLVLLIFCCCLLCFF